MNVIELIELTQRTHEILGWNGGGNIILEPNVMDVGDLWLYIEIHHSKIGSDLLESFEEMKNQLEALYGGKQLGIEFNEYEKADSGYGCSIIILGPDDSRFTSEKRLKEETE